MVLGCDIGGQRAELYAEARGESCWCRGEPGSQHEGRKRPRFHAAPHRQGEVDVLQRVQHDHEAGSGFVGQAHGQGLGQPDALGPLRRIYVGGQDAKRKARKNLYVRAGCEAYGARLAVRRDGRMITQVVPYSD